MSVGEADEAVADAGALAGSDGAITALLRRDSCEEELIRLAACVKDEAADCIVVVDCSLLLSTCSATVMSIQSRSPKRDLHRKGVSIA